MRIIAGTLKGKKLAPLPGLSIRPTSDKVREAIFNICAAYIPDAIILDLFAGTGALSIEALSRGANFAVLMDSSIRALSIIEKNIIACRLENLTKTIKWDILKNLNCLKTLPHRFNLVFMDPPYNKGAIRPTLKNLDACVALNNQAMIIIEHAAAEPIPDDLTAFELTNQRKYGKTLVSFLNYMISG